LLLEGSREEALTRLARELRRGRSTSALLRVIHDVGVREVVPLETFRGPHHILVCLHAVASVEAALGDARERILPVLWAAGLLREALEQKDRPRHREIELRTLPEPGAAAAELARALEDFDHARAEEAVAALCRARAAPVAAQTLRHYGSRDFREIGHKIIHVLEGTRRLPAGADAELAYRSVALTLCLRDEAEGLDADGAWPVNERRAATSLEPGRYENAAITQLLAAMRSASPIDASGEALAWRSRGASEECVLDAVDLFAAELMFNNPASVEALHAVTSAHADRTALLSLEDPRHRTLHLLQSVARAVSSRDYVRFWTSKGRPPASSAMVIESLAPTSTADFESVALGFGSATTADRIDVARRTLAAAGTDAGAAGLLHACRRHVAPRIQNVHDLKLATAAAEASARLAPAWRARYLAACSARLCGDAQPRWALADALLDA
jgi:hypothetical protein